MSEIKVLKHFLDLFDDDMESVTEIALVFCDQIPVSLQNLNHASEDKDRAKVKLLVHQLKGTIGYLGFDSEVKLIKTIESTLAEDSLETIAHHVVELSDKLMLLVMNIEKDVLGGVTLSD